MGRAWILCKKLFSLSLVFNALLTIACAISILGGVYWYYSPWKPFTPYLVDGSLFWVAILAAVVNIFPSARTGRDLHTGRFLFHHYFYGIVVFLLAVAYVVFFTGESLLTIFITNNTSIAVNAGRFFLLGGLTLLLDDLPDVSRRLESALNWAKDKAQRAEKILSVVHIITGGISLYVFAAVSLAMAQNPDWITLANSILVGTLFVTGVTSLIFVKRGAWVKPEAAKTSAPVQH